MKCKMCLKKNPMLEGTSRKDLPGKVGAFKSWRGFTHHFRKYHGTLCSCSQFWLFSKHTEAEAKQLKRNHDKQCSVKLTTHGQIPQYVIDSFKKKTKK